MDASYFIPNEADTFLVSQYRDFLPKKIFDAHMHMPLGVTIPSVQGTGVYFREAFTPEDYLRDMGPLLPGVEKIRLNMIPHPADRIQRHRENAGKRTMWGSDYPAAMLRGRAVGVGKWQDWLVDDAFKGPERALIPVENLLAFYHAALLLNLDQAQIDDIFYHNAEALFGKE